MNKLKMWEKAWDERAQQAAQKHPIKMLKQMPSMPGITEETAKNLKWKSLKWMISQDHEGHIRKGFMKHPFRYGWSFLKSIFKKKSYSRDGDFFSMGSKARTHLKTY